jgi:hypothetical protein
MQDQEITLLRIQIRDFSAEMANEMAKLKAEMSGLYRALREIGLTQDAIDELRASSAQDYLSAKNELRRRLGLPRAEQ